MDFLELAACGVGMAEVVSDSNSCIVMKWTLPTDCLAHIIVGIGKGFHCRILNKKK